MTTVSFVILLGVAGGAARSVRLMLRWLAREATR